MKHPFWDRILMLITAIVAIAAAAGLVMLILGKFSVDQITAILGKLDFSRGIVKALAGACAALFALFGVFMLSMMTPARKKRSSNFAIQRNENGMVRISLKALETLVNKVLNQHAELKVVTSSLYSNEESIRVDVHIALQSDISMPLAISSLQKQIKRYIEACSGVQVQEVRIFVDSTLPADENAAKSPYAIPESLLKGTGDTLTEGHPEEEPVLPPKMQPVPERKPEPVPEPARAKEELKEELRQSDFMREAYAPMPEPKPEEEPAAPEMTPEEEPAEEELPAEEQPEEEPAEEELSPEAQPEEEPAEEELPAEEQPEEEPAEEELPPEEQPEEEPAEEELPAEEQPEEESAEEEFPPEEQPEEEPAEEEFPLEEQPEEESEEEELLTEEIPEEGSAFSSDRRERRETGESAFGMGSESPEEAEGIGDAL